MTRATETKRLQTDRDRAVRRRLRAGVLRLDGGPALFEKRFEIEIDENLLETLEG